jgi:peroxiredoxin
MFQNIPTADVLAAGAKAPDFSLMKAPQQSISLKKLRGKPVILAFYPADWSPVCSDQMALYNEILPEFAKYGAELFGVSVDTGQQNASIDMTVAAERGISVTFTGYRSTPTIELTWGLILAIARHNRIFGLPPQSLRSTARVNKS